MKKIAIYCRQSIEKKDSVSIETQIESCKSLIKNLDEGRYEVYSDKGYSGKNTDRPEFQRMMTDVKDDKIEKILCYKLDRISRSLLDFNLMWQELDKHKCSFGSFNEHNLDSESEYGVANINLIMTFAQLERQTTARRVKDNYYFRIGNDGRWAGGPAPFGFYNGRTKDRKPTLIVNDSEMEIVKYCFNTYANKPNVSLRQICNYLTENDYKSRRDNGGWDNVTISRILQNSVYACADEKLYTYYEIRKIKFLNQNKWDGTTSCHVVGKKPGNANVRKYVDLKEQSVYLTNFEGVIDSKTFIKVQERLEQNQQIKRSNAPSILKELAGLIKCAKCGYAVKSYSKSTNGMPYLSCYAKYGLKSCDATFHGVKFVDIQKRVGEEIQKQLNIAEKEIMEIIISGKRKEREIDDLKLQMDRLVELVAQGGETATIVHSKIEKIQEQIYKIQLDNQMGNRMIDRFTISDTLPIVYERYSTEQKKNICQTLIEKILLSENGDIEIVWKI